MIPVFGGVSFGHVVVLHDVDAAEGAEALDAWVVFEGTTARVFTKVTTLDAPPSGPDGGQRFILNLRAAESPGEAGGGEGAQGG